MKLDGCLSCSSRSFSGRKPLTFLSLFRTGLVSALLFSFISAFGYADYVKWVYVTWTDGGTARSDIFYANSSQTIYRDAGTPVNIRVYKLDSGAPASVQFFFHDWNNSISLTNTASTQYYEYANRVGPLETQVWAGINNYVDKVEIFIRNNDVWYPDLIVSNITIDSRTTPLPQYYIGDTVNISANVWNQGQESAESSYLGFYLGISPSDTISRWSSTSVSSLSSGTGISRSSSYTFTSDDAGTRYFVLMADYQDQVEEGPAENNNISSIGPFSVTVRPIPVISSFLINSGDPSTESTTVTLNNSCSNNPTHYMASEDASFSGASWQIYSLAPSFVLSSGNGTKRVYFKVKNSYGESSGSIYDEILLAEPEYRIEIYDNSWNVTKGNPLTVRGRVIDDSEAPVPNVSVHVEDPIKMQSIQEIDVTDQNGEFSYTITTNFSTPSKNYTFVFFADWGGDCYSSVTLSVSLPTELGTFLENFKTSLGPKGTTTLSPSEKLVTQRVQQSQFIPRPSRADINNAANEFIYQTLIFAEDYFKTVITDPVFYVAAFGAIAACAGSAGIACPAALILLTKTMAADVIDVTVDKGIEALPASVDKDDIRLLYDAGKLAKSVVTFSPDGSYREFLGITEIGVSAANVIRDLDGRVQKFSIAVSDDNVTDAVAFWRITPRTPMPSSPQDEATIGMLTPTLTWSAYQHGGDNELQAGYQIKIESLTDGGQVVYNTGFISNPSSSSHAYAAGAYTGTDPVTGDTRISLPLSWGKYYRWTLRCQDGGGDWSSWSPASHFYTNAIAPATISRTPSSLSVSCIQGQNATSQSFEVWNSGGGTLSYTIGDNASWLAETPASGTSTGEHDPIQVSFTTSGLGAGTHNATITIGATGASNTPQTLPVTLTINPPVPSISRTPSSLSVSCIQGQNPPSQSFEVWNSGGGTLSYTIGDNASWLAETPASGTSTGEHDPIQVSFTTSGLGAGTHNATITISATGASNTPQTILVALTVNSPGPIVTTTAVTSITQTTAASGGNVTSDGGATVTARGVCWSTAVNPTIANNKTVNGSGTGSFSSSITGLSPSTTYHVRAYGTTSNGTAYGDDIAFTTQGSQPTDTLFFADFENQSMTAWEIVGAGQVGISAEQKRNGLYAMRLYDDSSSNSPGVRVTLSSGSSRIGLEFYEWTNDIGWNGGTVYQLETTTQANAGWGFMFGATTYTAGNWRYVTTQDKAVWAQSNPLQHYGTDFPTIIPAETSAWHKIRLEIYGPEGLARFWFDDLYKGEIAIAATSEPIRYVSHGISWSAPTGTLNYIDDFRIYNLTGSPALPTVTTTALSSITQTSALGGGTIISDGGTSVTARGVCWSTTPNPAIAGSKTVNGSGTGSYTSSITGLTSNTTYYVRAYATNSAGTAYGAELTFKTLAAISIPAVTTTAVTSITQTTATSGGNVTSGGGATVTARGVCWSTAANPTIANSKTVNGSGTGTFSSLITGLSSNATYHVRAYATNSAGTAYGIDIPFTTPGLKPVNVISPNGGEYWGRGTTQTVNWSYVGDIGAKVKIQLYRGTTLKATLTPVGGTPTANRSIAWKVPATMALGTNYKIRVTSTTNKAYIDESDAPFNIVAESFTVTAPNGGERLTAGTTAKITWTYKGNPGANVKIELLKGGSVDDTITLSTSRGTMGKGTFSWPIPPGQPFGKDYKIRISSTTNSRIFDESNEGFVIHTGLALAWGSNNAGELGTGTLNPNNFPIPVSTAMNTIKALSAGRFFSAALKADGTIWTWGRNLEGQLGIGTYTNSLIPTRIGGVTGATSVALGRTFGMALTSAGKIQTWGENTYGQLGNAKYVNSTIPVFVSGLLKYKAVAGGDFHAAAVAMDGTVRAWGSNSYGQIGNGTSGNKFNKPIKVLNLAGVMALAAGSGHTAALKKDGTVRVWGNGAYGQLGNATFKNMAKTPVAVKNLTKVTSIASGGFHMVALRSDGTVWTWGLNDKGQLGNGVNSDRNLPAQVGGLDNIIAIAAGGSHSLALRSDGTVWAWGLNDNGQLGLGNNIDSNIPVKIGILADVVGIAGGYMHSIVLK